MTKELSIEYEEGKMHPSLVWHLCWTFKKCICFLSSAGPCFLAVLWLLVHLFVPVLTAVALFLGPDEPRSRSPHGVKDSRQIKDSISGYFWSFDSNTGREVIWGLQRLRSLGLDFCSALPQDTEDLGWTGVSWRRLDPVLGLLDYQLHFFLFQKIFLVHNIRITHPKLVKSYGIGYYGTKPCIMF